MANEKVIATNLQSPAAISGSGGRHTLGRLCVGGLSIALIFLSLELVVTSALFYSDRLGKWIALSIYGK